MSALQMSASPVHWISCWIFNLRVDRVVLKTEEDLPDTVFLGIQAEIGFVKLLPGFGAVRR